MEIHKIADLPADVMADATRLFKAVYPKRIPRNTEVAEEAMAGCLELTCILHPAMLVLGYSFLEVLED